MDDDVFYALHAAYNGHLLEARSHQKLVRQGFANPIAPSGRRTWLTDHGKRAFLAEERRRDALPTLTLVGDDEDDDDAEPKAAKRPSGTYPTLR